MPIPAHIVQTVRCYWHWQWNQLMSGLAPCDKDGNYLRPESEHLQADLLTQKEMDGRVEEEFPTLIIGKSCPWAHRTWLVYVLKGLSNSINLIIAKPSLHKGKWELSPSCLGCNYLESIYKLCDSPLKHRATVPVLIDPYKIQGNKPRLLGNESTQLIEVLNKWPGGIISIELSPIELQDKIIYWSDIIQHKINNGVYKCGFARNQSAYNKASKELFDSLNKLEKHLAKGSKWICGENITLADIRLFPTLIRWENVYAPLFGCSETPLWKFPNIWQWRARLFNFPKVALTCDSES